MDIVVRAIPFTHKLDLENWIGGDGIEARYMRSIEKCKKQYEGIWKRAMKHDMNYVGFVSPTQIAKGLAHCRVMVDLSFSRKFEPYGCHVNRSTMEAYNAGAVPLLVNENMEERRGVSQLFRVGETHLGVPFDITPKDLAKEIDKACTMPPKKAQTIVMNGRELLEKHWTYQAVTQHFLQLAAGKKRSGIYQNLVTGRVTPELQEARDRYIARVNAKR
jgi:hypothetical protein